MTWCLLMHEHALDYLFSKTSRGWNRYREEAERHRCVGVTKVEDDNPRYCIGDWWEIYRQVWAWCICSEAQGCGYSVVEAVDTSKQWVF